MRKQMNYLKKTLFISVVAINSTLVFAEESKKKEPKGLFGAAEFGMVVTSGNTDTSTTTGKFELSYDDDEWLHFGKLEIVTADVDNASTAERYLLNLKSDLKMDDDQFMFVGLTHDVDKFSGFDSQSTLVLGYGRNLYNTENFQLSAEIGPGYRMSELEDGTSEDESILHVASKGKYTINEASHIVSDLTIDGGSDQTITVFNIGYVNKLNNRLALKLSYNVKKSSDVPVGIEDTDTITSISLLYSF